MQDTLARTRCLSCGRALGFAEWSEGAGTCGRCLDAAASGPAATYVPGPRLAAGAPRAAAAAEYAAFERMVDEIPDELIDELVAALEAEARKDAPAPATTATAAVREVLDDLGLGKSPREMSWALWGFALGFGGNVAVAKYAQVSSGAPIGQFVAPLLLGGLVAGATCAIIAWGFAKLRDR